MKKTVFAATLAATLLLAGCGKGTNMPKKFKTYLDHTFGGNYTVEEVEDSEYNRTWNVTYTDVFGKEHTTELYGSKIDDGDKEIFGNQENFDCSELYYFSVDQISNIARTEFYERFIADRLEFDMPDGMICHNDKDETLTLGVLPLIYSGSGKHMEYIKQQISAEDGMKISEYDLKQAAQNPYMYIVFNVSADISADPQECIDKMEEIYSEFLSYTESPQNYRFTLKQKKEEDGDFVRLFNKTVILGEEIDEEAMEKDGGKFYYSSELRKRLFGEK